MDNQQLAQLVLADLGAILERTRVAYVDGLPGVRVLSDDVLARMLAATRRTVEQFCRYWVEGTLSAEAWGQVRDATIERAGELFSAEEIVEIMDMARKVGLASIRDLAERYPDLTETDRARLADAIDRFVSEIAEQEDQLRPVLPTAHWDSVLAELEHEEADLR